MSTRKFYCKKVVVIDHFDGQELIRVFNDKEEVANWYDLAVGTVESYIRTRRSCAKLGGARFYYLYEYTLLEEERAKAQYEEYFFKRIGELELKEV